MYQTVRMPCSGGWYCRVVVRIDKREGERENNTFWYIKEMIERELNKAYRINIPQNKTDGGGCPKQQLCEVHSTGGSGG